jgi:hypothetical protein
MDGPNYEPDTKTRPFQESLYPPIEHEDLSSIYAAEQAAGE